MHKISKPPTSKPPSTGKGRLRSWSFSRSKDKKAQDQHFVRTNSGRWIKTEHALISTDDEDDEARRRREEMEAAAAAAAENDDNNDYLPFDAHHEQRADLDYDPTQDGPLIPPWHATKPAMQWDPYSHHDTHPSSSFQPTHTHSQSQPANQYFPTESPPINTADSQLKMHTPPTPIPFPTPGYVPSTPGGSREDRRGRMKYKPGSLYPMHNPIRPAQPYTNWHLQPPDNDLPAIFGYVDGAGAGSGGGAKGTSTPGTDGVGQTASGNGSASGFGTSPAKEHAVREGSRDGRSYPPTTQPPRNLQQATSAILGHSASHQSLGKLAAADNTSPMTNHIASAISPPSNSDSAIHPTNGSNTSQPHVLGGASATAPMDSTTLDLADPWGTAWSHSSPYDLGRAPVGGLKIPAFQQGVGGSNGSHPGSSGPTDVFSPKKRKLSPLGGMRSRKPSQEPLDRSGRPSVDRDRSMEPSSSRPPSPNLDTSHHALEKQTSNLGYEDGDDRKGKKSGGLRALFSGSTSHLPSQGSEDGFLPRVRKRTISLGQTGIGIPIPSLGGNPTRARKQSFEVIRKPSVRPHTVPTTTSGEPQAQDEGMQETVAVDVDDSHPGEETHPEASTSNVLPDADIVMSPVEEPTVQRSPSHVEDRSHSARPSLDTPQRQSSDSRRPRSSKELGRSPSLTRPSISGPMPLKKSPSTSSMSRGAAAVLTSKKSTSHLGHGVLEGIGLGRKPSQTTAIGNPIGPSLVRGRKTSKVTAPPRTLHRYAQSIEQFEAMYSSSYQNSSASDIDQDKRASGGVLGKLARKLSWMTKSAKDREREAQVQEKMRQFERESALEKRLDEARAKASMDIDRTTDDGRCGSENPKTGSELHDAQTEDASEGFQGSFEPLPLPDRSSLGVREIQAPLNLSGGLSENEGSEHNHPPRRSSSQISLIDPRSPTHGTRKSLLKSPSGRLDNAVGSPATSVDQSLSPLGKLAAAMMSPRSTTTQTPAAHSMSLFSPINATASLLSPKKQPSTTNLSLNFTSPAPFNLNPSPTYTPSAQNHGDGRRGSFGQGHSRQPSPGPSSVPPRPATPPDRQESPLPIPRMALTIMNPDIPSPPTPIEELIPIPERSHRLQGRRQSVAPVPSPAKNESQHESSPAARSPIPASSRPRPRGHERTSTLPKQNTFSQAETTTESSETDDQRIRLSHRPRDNPGLPAGAMSPNMYAFPRSEAGSASGYGQHQLVLSGHQTPYASSTSIMSPAQVHAQAISQSDSYAQPWSQSETQSQLMSPASDYRSGIISYAVAAPSEARTSESLTGYSQHTGMILQNGILSSVTVMMLHPNQHQVIPALSSRANPMPPPPQMHPTPYTTPQAVDSESSLSSPAEVTTTTTAVHAMYNYEPAAPVRPAMLAKTASDPLAERPTTSMSSARSAVRRGETISALGKQWEVVVDENGRELTDPKYRRASVSKPRRKTSSKQHSGDSDAYGGGIVIEEIRGMDSYEVAREKEREITRERERDREKARQHWEKERHREQERDTAKERRRQEQDAAKEEERHRLKEIERQARENVWIGPTEHEYDRERDRRERHSRKVTRSSTISTIPPTPPPKERNDVRPKMPTNYSSSSSSAQAAPISRHLSRQSRRSHTADSFQGPPPPPKPNKLLKSPTNHPAPIPNMNANVIPHHHLDHKPLPRPMSDVSVEPVDGGRANEAWVKDRMARGTSLAMDRSEMVEHLLGKSMPTPPKMVLDAGGSPNQQRKYLADRSLQMSPQSSRRGSIMSGPGHGSGYTSFNLQSPFTGGTPMSQRPPLGYVPALKNAMPRPPRDISLDVDA